jgi:RNA polymerase sigma factor (sigma-70 family)
MAKSAEVDDPSQHVAAGAATPARRKDGTADAFGVPPLAKYKRRPELTEELRRWYALEGTARLDELRRAAGGERRWSIETLMHAVRQAWTAGDRRAYVQTFNAFATRATPLLMQQARKHNAGEDEDHAQEVLLRTAKDVQAGKAEYAEANFADYAMRKAIDGHRRVDTRLESKLKRAAPQKAKGEDDSDGLDPLDAVPNRLPSPEARALLKLSVGKLEGDLRDVFIQYHVHGLTYEEIAEQHEVDESTIRNWVKRAGRLVGHQGGNDDHEN